MDALPKKSFLWAAFGVCKGTDAFVEIAMFPTIKTAFHFILFACIASVISAGLRTSLTYAGTIGRFCAAFEGQFGHVSNSGAKGVLPSLSPETSRSMVVDNIRVDYISGEGKGPGFRPDDGISNCGLLWMPKSMVFWGRNGPKFRFFSLADLSPSRNKISTGTADQVLAYAQATPLPADLASQIPSASLITLKNALIVSAFLLSGANVFLVTVLFIPLFALFSTFFFSASATGMIIPMRFRNILNVAIYSSFPGILIASLFHGFDIPYVEYQTMCVICFLIYFTVVLNNLQRKARPSSSEESDYDDF